ncbi:MAG: NAD(P)-dependent oxidoreductase [Chloroflexota bacterium]
MPKTKVALFGASGTMGFQAFQTLWQRRDRYDLSILVLPSEQRRNPFLPCQRQAGVPAIRGSGVVQGNGLKIVWGDAANYADVAETIRGADWVLNAMAYISPQADYHPELAQRVNHQAVAHILDAIAAEPDGAQRIAYIHTGSVAQTGNRPPGIHFGRVGDPLKPSVFDSYALTKIAGERLVLESSLRRWAVLRMTFIMPTRFRDLLALNDPILFHMPLDACMENITDRDAGFGLANCLDISPDSDFWRRVYNMGGGPALRLSAHQFLTLIFDLYGLRLSACAERNWFALRNFHMQYFADSHILNDYLHHQRDTLESYLDAIRASTPPLLRAATALTRRAPALRTLAERLLYATQRRVAENHPNSPRHWLLQGNQPRITAFFKSRAMYDAIPGWHAPLPNLSPTRESPPLAHGYDENRPRLSLADLRRAAAFRGGACLSSRWDGDLYAPLDWRCAFGHTFSARAYSVLKGGHWCPHCVAAWNGDEQARRNPFFAQVWHADHDPQENHSYPPDCIEDIRGADHQPLIRRTRRPLARPSEA